jgi:hypothetical protein
MALTFLEFCNRYHDSPPAAAAALPNVICFARPGHLSLAEHVRMGARERVSVCAWSCRGAAGMVKCVRVRVCACLAAAHCACLRMHVRAFTAPGMFTGGLAYTPHLLNAGGRRNSVARSNVALLCGENSQICLCTVPTVVFSGTARFRAAL